MKHESLAGSLFENFSYGSLIIPPLVIVVVFSFGFITMESRAITPRHRASAARESETHDFSGSSLPVTSFSGIAPLPEITTGVSDGSEVSNNSAMSSLQGSATQTEELQSSAHSAAPLQDTESQEAEADGLSGNDSGKNKQHLKKTPSTAAKQHASKNQKTSD